MQCQNITNSGLILASAAKKVPKLATTFCELSSQTWTRWNLCLAQIYCDPPGISTVMKLAWSVKLLLSSNKHCWVLGVRIIQSLLYFLRHPSSANTTRHLPLSWDTKSTAKCNVEIFYVDAFRLQPGPFLQSCWLLGEAWHHDALLDAAVTAKALPFLCPSSWSIKYVKCADLNNLQLASKHHRLSALATSILSKCDITFARG